MPVIGYGNRNRINILVFEKQAHIIVNSWFFEILIRKMFFNSTRKKIFINIAKCCDLHVLNLLITLNMILSHSMYSYYRNVHSVVRALPFMAISPKHGA